MSFLIEKKKKKNMTVYCKINDYDSVSETNNWRSLSFSIYKFFFFFYIARVIFPCQVLGDWIKEVNSITC